MSKLRVGIIGTGGISNSHMSGYKSLPDEVEVVAVCDINEPKVKAYAEKYGVPVYYTDYNEMLAKENLDCVSVTTWNSVHMPATVAALNAGCNVICEKPMAMNAKEAEIMLETAKKTGKLLQIGFVRRFGDDAISAKKYIDAGVIGDIYYGKAQYLRRRGCPGGWFGDKEYSGGGPLIDLGVHVMDLVRYLGGCPKPVAAFGATFDNLTATRDEAGEKAWTATTDSNGFKFNVEDFTTAFVRFDNGLVMSVEASFNLNIKGDMGAVELFGTKSAVHIDPFEIYGDTAEKYPELKPVGPTHFDFGKAFKDEIAAFIDSAKNGTPCKAPAEDGVALMKIIDAIYESAETGHEAVISW